MTGSAMVLDEATVATLFERADIILIRGNGLISLLIRWATRSYWNHVAIVFVLADEATGQHEGYRRTFIIEAAGVAQVVNRWICSGVAQFAFYRACFGADLATGATWDPYFDDLSHRERVVFNSDVRPDVAGGLGFPQAEERLRLTTPAHFALAATFGALEVAAERIGGSWGTRLIRT